VHAAGVVIAPTELTDFTPLQKETGGNNIITQYEMHAVEDAGLVKMDFLGIRNLSILGNAVKLIKKTKSIDVDIDNLPLDDKKTFKLLAEGRTMGMFQLGGAGMTRYLVELKPTKVTDIMAMVALFRPGPMESIPEFIARKHNPSLVTYLDPRMEKYLKNSYGIITYQDDVLYTSIEIAGYNWEEADKLRKAMGKKIPEEMAAQKDKFLKGSKEHGGLDISKAEELWALIEPFAAYGFGRAHAASYGMVAYQTAYLKAHYTAEFMAAVMSAESDDIEKVAVAVEECKALKIRVLPPDVNESFADFTVVNDETIRFGLNAIKNVGNHIISVIITERKKQGKFKDVVDLLERVVDRDLNRKSLESFTKSGALDSLGSRHTFFQNMEILLAYAKEAHEAAARNQESLFGTSAQTKKALTLVEAPADAREALNWEKELLGLYLSGHPLDQYRNTLEASPVKIGAITGAGAKIKFFAFIKEAKEITTKKGDLMAFATVEDLSGSAELIVFPKSYSKFREILRSNQLVEITGKTEERLGSIQIICEEIKQLSPDELSSISNDKVSQAPAPKLELFLSNHASNDTFAKLKKILYNTSGKSPVILRINHTKKIILPVGVEVNKGLIDELKQFIGEDNVRTS